ncbi:complex I subunit 4 family protein [Fervidibacillus halotolerans]|uniref:NADH-quinone oxidoreductase subunit M n=1 Tax=Fervidibacillus halotolerans TaxID=2980027 RepID=A0A9E8RYF7_9BACI|nr:NADH-quinone oxidoreductase subunit M [Fervidibacillus halotolerans]WAA12164.1 NADH-quinone oxidoreductase subunit M [Fervidibacillus halotolerans]
MAGNLSLLVFSPLVFGILLLVVRKKGNWIGILATFFPVIVGSFFFHQYFKKGIQSISEKWPWISFHPKGFDSLKDPSFLTIDYELQLDGISLAFILLTVLLTFLAAILSWNIEKHRNLYFLLLLLLEIGMLGLFVAANLFLFFIFFEMTVVCLFFLSGKYGEKGKEKAAFHLLLYNGAGSAFLLFAIVLLFLQTGTVHIEQLQHLLHTGSVQLNELTKWSIVLSILIAFGIKMPVFPFHQWMVLMHSHVHPAIVILHSGVLLKIATYGLFRFGIGLFPNEWEKISGLLLFFALVNIFYGSLFALRQMDLRRVWAYGSVAHMGFVLLGLALGSETGIRGALFQSISHGLISGLLFLIVALILTRFKTTDIGKLSGLRQGSPFAVFLLFVGGMASLGLPATSGFIGEFLVILAAFEHHPMVGTLASVGIVLATGYILRAILSISYGPLPSMEGEKGTTKDFYSDFSDENKGNNWKWNMEKKRDPRVTYEVYEWLPAIVFVLFLIGLGIYPQWLIEFFVGA